MLSILYRRRGPSIVWGMWDGTPDQNTPPLAKGKVFNRKDVVKRARTAAMRLMREKKLPEGDVEAHIVEIPPEDTVASEQFDSATKDAEVSDG